MLRMVLDRFSRLPVPINRLMQGTNVSSGLLPSETNTNTITISHTDTGK